jgi:vitamin B12/bleomycin/antimicrobial peptide transport system ATP-binding/permease protein
MWSHSRRHTPASPLNSLRRKSSGAGKASIGGDVRFAWTLIRAYWTSPDKYWAYGLTLVVGATEALSVWLMVAFNTWHVHFYDAIVARDLAAFWINFRTYFAILLGIVVMAACGGYARQWLVIRWRACLTDLYVGRWLARHRFYVIERAKSVENPDQRMSEDLNLAVQVTTEMVSQLAHALGTFGSFSVLLWQQSGPISFAIAGLEVTIPGYLFWVALAYAALSSVAAHYTGRSLTVVDVLHQRYEADFRVRLVRVRENAEQIALYGGAPTERGRLAEAFDAIRQNWFQVMNYTMRLTMLQTAMIYLSMAFSTMVSAPRYFAGAVTLGGMQQIGNSFLQVVNALGWFVQSYSRIAGWRAVMERLQTLDRALDAPAEAGITVAAAESGGLYAADLRLDLPDGTELVWVGTFSVAAGERVMLQGRSGAGKSTLLRALAGLWPHGSGTVEIPERNTLMFLPQRSYVPVGTLRAALCYPAEEAAFDAQACAAALTAVGLDAFCGRLEEADHWANRMSPGEQQRLAAARALIHRPDFLLLDEATSALDSDLERIVYEAIIDALPGTALISIAHRPTVAKYHNRIIRIGEVEDAAPMALVGVKT